MMLKLRILHVVSVGGQDVEAFSHQTEAYHLSLFISVSSLFLTF